MIRAITFDLEGTVVDLEWAHWGGHLAAAAEAGVELTQEEAIQRLPHFVGGPDEAVAKEIAALTEGRMSLDYVLERSKFHFRQLVESVYRIEVRPGFLRVFRFLSDAGMRTAIGSLTDRELAEHLLRESGLNHLFHPSHIVLREDVENPKPAPDVYLKTALLMGVVPEDQLVFEDSVNGVLAARKARSRVVGMPTVRTGDFTRRLLDAGASRVFFAWNEICVDALLRNLDRKED